MQLDENMTQRLLSNHRRLALQTCIFAIPEFLVLLCFRVIFLPLSLLNAFFLFLCELGDPFTSIFFVTLLYTLPFSFFEITLSERFTRRLHNIIRLPKDSDTSKLQNVLSSPKPFVLFIRDFDAKENRMFFDYKPFWGTTVNEIAHRDDSVFVTVKIADLIHPVIAIANGKDPVPTNKDILFLRVLDEEWMQVVKLLMIEARSIIAVIDDSKDFRKLFSVSNIEGGKRVVGDYWADYAKAVRKNAGLAMEIEEIINEEKLYHKTIITDAYQNDPGITSKWFELRTFTEIDDKEVVKIING